MLDAFDIFGLEMSDEMKESMIPKEKAAEKKVADKKEGKKTTSKKIDSVTLPVTVVTGYGRNFTLTDTAFPNKKPEDVTVSDVKAAVAKVIKGLSGSYIRAGRKDDKTVYVTVNSNYAVYKGKITLKDNSKCYIQETEISLDDIKTEAECEIEIEKFLGYLTEKYPGFTFSVVKDKDDLFLIPGMEDAEKEVKLPVTIKVFGRDDVTLTKEDFVKPVTKSEEPAEEELEEEVFEEEEVVPDTAKTINSVSLSDVQKKFVEKYPEWDKAVKLMKGTQNEKAAGTVLVARFIQYNEYVPMTSTPKKEETYPTDATVSMIFRRIQLSPADFGGKTEINKKELCQFLAKDYPEFEADRTWIVYDKDKKLIMPQVKGSGKGASSFSSFSEAEEAAENEEYFLCSFRENGKSFRMEKTAISMTVATESGDEGTFRWYLKKIPGAVFKAVRDFFKMVADKHNSEALVWIYYHPTDESYEIYVPTQRCTVTSVNELEFPVDTEERYRVMDIHSHGNIGAFFSSQDNRDEKGNRLFGVWGNFRTEPVFKLRAGTGGKYFYLNAEDVFDDLTEETDEFLLASQHLYMQWKNRVNPGKVKKFGTISTFLEVVFELLTEYDESVGDIVDEEDRLIYYGEHEEEIIHIMRQILCDDEAYIEYHADAQRVLDFIVSLSGDC